ncbi:MAG: thiamine-phosphate kinase [Chthoniobacteraceae bacterium]|nr:thiamine-phosphate kinase [Chthoniobacteraceae bacterium]
MKLSGLGEDALVARWTRNPPRHAALRVGPGDDCAAVGGPRDTVWTLLKTDAVVEGVHFTPDADFTRVGWKALARAVSDIAAMGGEPEHALVTVAFPPALELAKADALYAGLRRCARKFGISLAGGETTRSPGPVFVSVALTGRVERARCALRSGGKPGDVLFVTGRLGGSLAGKHLDFTPRVREARWLVAHFRLHAMMDLSDGLGADLPRLARASGCGFELRGPLPCAPGCSQTQALGDGEDFELLFAVSPRQAARVERAWPFARLPLTRVGILTANQRSTTLHGFDHFA